MINDIKLLNENLYSYQIEAKKNIYESWSEGNRSVLLQMPTGTGKTTVFCSIAREFYKYAIEKNLEAHVLIVAHKIELIEQISKNLLTNYSIDSGIIKSGKPANYNKIVQVISIQSLGDKFNRNVSLIIIDEAHHAIAETYQKLWDKFPNAYFLGVTATPYRLDGTGLNSIFQDLIISPNIKWFIKNNNLSKIEYLSIKENKLELNDIKEIAGDYDNAELFKKFGERTEIRANIVESYKKYLFGKKGIVYTINKEHNKLVCEDYKKAGISAYALDSDSDDNLRETVLND